MSLIPLTAHPFQPETTVSLVSVKPCPDPEPDNCVCSSGRFRVSVFTPPFLIYFMW